MHHLKNVPVTISSNVDQTYYGKFLKSEEKIRNLAAADPNSYAAVVVRSMDHLIMGRKMLADYSNASCYNPSLVAAILKEFSISMRASEIFAIWTPEIQSNLTNLVDHTLKDQKCKTSDMDRDARVCSAILISDPAKTIKFVDVCRKKYPNEVFFHRVYCDLFTYTKDLDSGLKAINEVSKLFPNNPNILYSRAGFLRLMNDTDTPDYRNLVRQKKQIEIVKEAYKNYLKVAPKDHRQFAESNYILAYLSLKYSTPSSKISHSDIQEITLHFQNGLNSEVDILPCFLPFQPWTKEFVAKVVNVKPPNHIYVEGNTCTVDITTNGIPGRPISKTVPTENMTFIDLRKPTERFEIG